MHANCLTGTHLLCVIQSLVRLTHEVNSRTVKGCGHSVHVPVCTRATLSNHNADQLDAVKEMVLSITSEHTVPQATPVLGSAVEHKGLHTGDDICCFVLQTPLCRGSGRCRLHQE